MKLRLEYRFLQLFWKNVQINHVSILLNKPWKKNKRDLIVIIAALLTFTNVKNPQQYS